MPGIHTLDRVIGDDWPSLATEAAQRAFEAVPYDERIQELVRGDRLGELTAVDPGWAVAAKADSFWQLLMLHGALGDAERALQVGRNARDPQALLPALAERGRVLLFAGRTQEAVTSIEEILRVVA